MARTKKDTSSPATSGEKASSLSSQLEKTKTKAKNYVMDLQVHSPASTGYLGVEGLDSAPAIVRLAKVKGLDVIAITDPYSGDFIDRMVKAAQSSPLTVVPGVGLRCRLGGCNEVMLTCLFPETTSTRDVTLLLDRLGVPLDMRGQGGYILNQSLGEVLHAIEGMNGVAIPSRMDKTPIRLGAIPELVETYGFRAFDLAYADSEEYFKRRWPKISFHLFTFSAAHALAQIGSRIARVKMAMPGFAGIREVVARQ
jgi:hypothetical protein